MKKTLICLIAVVAGALVTAAYAYGPGPYGYGDYPGPNYGYGPGANRSWQQPPWASESSRSQRTGLRMERRRDADAYYVTLYLNGLKPEDLVIQTSGRDIWIQNAQSQQTDQVETEQGYYRRFEMHSSSLNKHLRLPPDADMKNLVREDGENTIRFVIPRFQYR